MSPIVAVMTSSGVVIPASTLRRPSSRRVRMPRSRARCRIAETPSPSLTIRRMVNERMSVAMIRQRARDLGMRTLREDGLRKVLAGMTTPDEVITATAGDKE